jgi:hypothetical protein
VVVKKRCGIETFFSTTTLCRNSAIRNIIMESGIKSVFIGLATKSQILLLKA